MENNKVMEYINKYYPDWANDITDICDNGDVHFSNVIIKTNIITKTNNND